MSIPRSEPSTAATDAQSRAQSDSVPGDVSAPLDAQERARALDVGQSFLVRAPAGSGKTTLLTARYLALLQIVDVPEQILAVTFTRKAAAEMLGRIIGALRDAASGRRVGGPLEAPAAAVVARDAERGWQLLEAPSRLRVLTFDAFCAQLARSAPLAAPFGLTGAPQEDATALYREAARVTLLEPAPGAPDRVRQRILRALDNDLPAAEELLIDMLRSRDQWLPRLARSGDRNELEDMLRSLVERQLNTVAQCIAPHAVEVIALARYAAGNRKSPGPLAEWQSLASLPPVSAAALESWRGLSRLFLTEKGEWRKSVSGNDGFPPNEHRGQPDGAAGQMKARFYALVASLKAERRLQPALAALRDLPPPEYSDDQWQRVEALLELLKHASAELNVVFAERRACDFAGLALAAHAALGRPDAPSDLALTLDGGLRHVLVDEFQDTSFMQYELLEMLTAGWQQGDGRTLFLVGDPMQSIYRFRSALVDLFLVVQRQRRLGQVPLECLQLRSNFRAAPELVEWVNSHLAGLFPDEDIGVGAVPFAASQAVPARRGEARVQVHPLLRTDVDPEPAYVAQLVQAIRDNAPDAKVAVLARERRSADVVALALARAGVGFRGVDLTSLAERPVARDLLALTRALAHPADRIAWLSVLRAPWCGLLLADLDALTAASAGQSVMTLLTQPDRRARLSADGRSRIERILAALTAGVAAARRAPARDTVERVWRALGGPACLPDADGWHDAARYFDLLEAVAGPSRWPDTPEIEAALSALRVTPPADSKAAVEVMTIHKAKGLEFDVVIVTGLGARLGCDGRTLLRWVPYPEAGRAREWLLAPIWSSDEEKRLYEYLGSMDRAQAGHEETRLLYVAATRAIRELHWIARVERDAQGDLTPADSRGLLAKLWPALEASGRDPVATRTTAAAGDARRRELLRVPTDWQVPAPPTDVLWQGEATPSPAAPESVEYSWVGPVARHVGTVVHHFLALIARDGLEAWPVSRVRGLHAHTVRRLALMGVPATDLPAASARVLAALESVISSDRGRWVLASDHQEREAELPVTTLVAGVAVELVIDRTFVCSGTRWIIDFKTSTHEGSDREAFLDREQERYRAQLERYAIALRGLDARPVRLALYFPLLDGWREWTPPL